MSDKTRKRRINKTFLSPDYDPSKVHSTTDRRWRNKFIATIESEDSEQVNIRNLTSNPLPATSSASCIDLNPVDSSDSDSKVSSESPSFTHNPLSTNYVPKLSRGTRQVNDIYNCTSDSSTNSEVDDLHEYEEEQDDVLQNVHVPISAFKMMGNVLMFPQSGLNTRDVSLMLMGYSIRFISTYEGRDVLFEMIKAFAGPEYADWRTSKFILNELYDPPDEATHLCFLCDVEGCFEPLLPPITRRKFKPCQVTCKCGKIYNLTTQSPNYVISVNLKYQIEILLMNEDLKGLLLKTIKDVKNNHNSDAICDVYDSQLYKKIREQFSAFPYLVTYSFSTDGAPVNNSSGKSFWAKEICIQELPPDIRFKHPLLAGLSIAEKEPSPAFMNAYMKHFVSQARNLMKKGIETTDENGKSITLIVVPFCCPVDSVARPILQNRFQYNAYYGCSWCYQRGLHTNHAMHYPLEETEKLRTDESHRKNYQDKKASAGKSSEMGVKGFSVLLTLFCFDIVWGFPSDYLHAELLGVVKTIWKAWVSTKTISAEGIRTLNARILKMTPPHEIHRLSRPIWGKVKWKASEWRSWLLFYSIPCLVGLILDNCLDHMALFVDSIFILLQESITELELQKCEQNLTIFVGMYQELYEDITFNIHSVLHLVQHVRMTGPLWATSTFPFESSYYHLKQQVTGPKGLYFQISKRMLQKVSFNFTCKELASSELCLQFCANLFSPKRWKECTSINQETILLGYEETAQDGSKLYNRCIHKSKIYHSRRYSRPNKTNDTVVELFTGEVGEIEVFRHEEVQGYITISLFKIMEALVHVTHIRKVERSQSTITVPIEAILRKMVYMETEKSSYISRLPNNFEIQ